MEMRLMIGHTSRVRSRGRKLAGVPLDLGDHAARRLSALRLIAEAGVGLTR
jgi:hypothetical protein